MGKGVDRAIERLVIALPPKERACVLLKDVFDYSLEEIAALVELTTGGVKAALNRGRGKLATLTDVQRPERKASKEELALLRLYIDRFNRRDWQGVRELASADARLMVADCFAGRLADSPYFIEYEHPIIAWRMALGEADGETVVVIQRDDPAGPGSVFGDSHWICRRPHRQHYRLHQVFVDLGDSLHHAPPLKVGLTSETPRGSARTKKVCRFLTYLGARLIRKWGSSRIDVRAQSRVDEDLFWKLPLRRRSLSSRTRLRRGNVQVQLHELHESALLAHFRAGRSISRSLRAKRSKRSINGRRQAAPVRPSNSTFARDAESGPRGGASLRQWVAHFTPSRFPCSTTLIPTNSPPRRSAISTAVTIASIGSRTMSRFL